MEPNHNRSHAPAPAPTVVSGGNGILSTILVVLLIITSIMAIAWFGTRLAASGGSGAVKGKQYQAVFLTNGQVYFGKLRNTNNSYVKLTDIYYLQVQQQVQPKDNNASGQQPQVSLAKLGSELHGPDDTMYINHDQVLFWENLKDDGKVVKAIQDYKSGAKK